MSAYSAYRHSIETAEHYREERQTNALADYNNRLQIIERNYQEDIKSAREEYTRKVERELSAEDVEVTGGKL